jgi:hypothetical protein
MTARTSRSAPLAGLLGLACLASACGSGKREAMSLLAAVDRYRQAPMGSKAAPEAVLEKLGCGDAEVCAARDACLAAARPTIRGIALKDKVQSALDDLQAGRITRDQAAGMDLSKSLDEASRAIEEGQANMASCDAKVTALRIKYTF